MAETAAGLLLFFDRHGGLTASLLSSAPIWLTWVVSWMSRGPRSRAIRWATGTLGAFHALYVLAAVIAPVWHRSWLLPLLLPTAGALIAIGLALFHIWNSKRAILILTMMAMTALIVTTIQLRLNSATSAYAGALLIAAGSLGSTVFGLMCFFSAFTTISITGVILGAASLVMVRSVTRGFAHEFQDKVLGFNAHVLVMKNYYGFTEYAEVAKMVRKIPHVTGAAPFTIAEMIVTAKGRHTTVLMKGVDPRRVGEVLDLTKYVRVKGPADLKWTLHAMATNLSRGLVIPGKPESCQRFDEDGDPIPGATKNCKLPGIMIGTKLAHKLRVHRGDVIRLISPTAELESYRSDSDSDDGASQTVLARDFRVAGLFYCGFQEYDDKLVFVDLRAAQHFVNPASLPEDDNAVLGIEIKLDDIYQAGQVAQTIRTNLGKGDYRVVTWYELNRPLFEALRTQKRIMTLIVFITVVVAAFGILSALTMMVLTKTREIAILKAMGATSSSISRIFQFTGIMVGMVGVVAGTGLGVLNAQFLSRLHFPLDSKVYLISRLPVLVDWSEVGLVILSGLALCFLSTLYPARKASARTPVDGLRYE
ncbi:MAG: ABC transporter permease [Deltaproteobacteria bacterium]|nr:ABC transporter permease [Deltaproteobacteria bacterium]